MYGYGYRYSAKPGLLAFNPATLNNTQFYSDPTIQSSVNSNLCQSLDGSTDALNADALVGDLATTTTGIWAGWVKPVDATPTAQDNVFTFGDTDANEYITFSILTTSGIGAFICVVGGVTQWRIDTDAVAFTDGNWHHLALVQDGVLPKIYVDGSAPAQTTITSTDLTAWFNDATGLDNGRIGCLNINSGGNTGFFDGDVDEWGFWDNATSVTVASLYNSGNGKTLTDLTTAEKVGLAGYYTLNDYLDTSGNSNTLTAIGTPTDAIGKVQTEVIASENIYTLGDLSDAANNGTQTVLINEPTWNTTHVTYATNDFINIDDVISDISTSNNATFAFWVKPLDGTPVSTERFITFSDTSGSTAYMLIDIDTSGLLRAQMRIGAVIQWFLKTDAAAFTSGVWTHCALVVDGVEPVIYVDNVAVAQTFTVSTDKTKWLDTAGLIDNGRIGCIEFNGGAASEFYNGDMQQVYISSDAKDAATIKNLFNNNKPS